jgi:hypothetical protein
MVYDKEREDGTFTPQDPTSVIPPTPVAESNGASSSSQDAISQGEWNPLDNIFVTMPPWHPVTSLGGLNSTAGKPEKDKAAKNPVSHWRVSRRSVVGGLHVPFWATYIYLE